MYHTYLLIVSFVSYHAICVYVYMYLYSSRFHHTQHRHSRLLLSPSEVAPPRNLSGPEAKLLVLLLVLLLLPGAAGAAADIDRATGRWRESHHPAPKFAPRLDDGDDDEQTHLDGLLDSNP